MSERQIVVWGALLGTIVGAVTGYLFFTERGRRFRREIEPQLQTIFQEAMQIRKTVSDLRRNGAEASPRVIGSGAPLAWPRRS